MCMVANEGFLRAIREAPGDDVHRLVYADWLEDHGDPDRAQFIRVQCKLAQLPASDPEREPLRTQERHLLGLRGRDWLGPLEELGHDWRFHRGFVTAGTVTAE